jgi:hypothetical protein
VLNTAQIELLVDDRHPKRIIAQQRRQAQGPVKNDPGAESTIVTPNFKLLTLFIGLLVPGIMTGCAMRDHAPSGMAEVSQCRQAADAVTATDFDTRVGLLRMRADAYSQCMQERGYVLDEEELERKILHKEQVKNADPLGGDPAPILAVYREQLRMDPALWRAGTH